MTASLSGNIFDRISWGMRWLASIACACALCVAASGLAQAAEQEVRLMDYFYPKNLHAHWDYLTEKEKGGLKVTRVRMHSKTYKLNVFASDNGKPGDNYKQTLWMATTRGRISNDKLKFGGTLDSYDFYGARDNYAIYGFSVGPNSIGIRCNAAFPEKFAPMQSVSVTTGLYNSEGGRGPNAILSTQLIGKESVTVAAGTFEDCIHLRFTLEMKGVASETRDEWWAKGVGIVKTSAPKANGGSLFGELQGYDIPFEVTLDFYKSRGDFGRVFADQSGLSIYSKRTLTFRVVNRGKTTIPALDLSIFGSKRFICDRTSTGKLASGEMAEFTVTFAPWDYISYTALLRVEERDNPANRVTMMLRGIGDL